MSDFDSKTHRYIEYAIVSRRCYYEDNHDLTVLYVIESYSPTKSSYILDFKKCDNEYIIETRNTFYHIKQLDTLSYIDIEKELKDYLQSKEFKKFINSN